ncbi:MAG: SsrA-binding protein, partial [Pseudomonadales bacterium]
MAPKAPSNTIALNKRARFEYHLHDEFEAGVQLAGWEVKALRAGRVQLTESFVTMHRGEAYLHGCNINPLISAST